MLKVMSMVNSRCTIMETFMKLYFSLFKNIRVQLKSSMDMDWLKGSGWLENKLSYNV